jgi:hypothetical protein
VIFDALAGQREMWWLEGVSEPAEVGRMAGGYPARLLAFAASAINCVPQSP